MKTEKRAWKFKIGSLVKHNHDDIFYLILGQGDHTHVDYYYVWMFGPSEVIENHVDHDESHRTDRSRFYVESVFSRLEEFAL